MSGVKRYRLEGRSVSDTAALFMPDVVVDASDYDRLEQERAEQWRLRRDAEADRDTANAVAAELRAQAEATRDDAERYRWIRASFVRNHNHSLTWYLPWTSPLTASGLDANIDNARRTKP